jgi:hypothetical protein
VNDRHQLVVEHRFGGDRSPIVHVYDDGSTLQ